MWVPFKSYEQKARYIIRHNKYMVIATADRNGDPWGATVFYAPDEHYNFYFISANDSLHAKNIAENQRVALVIFDSRSPIGTYDEVQVHGKAEVVGIEDLKAAITIYTTKLFAHTKMPPNEQQRYEPREYVEPSEFRFFKVTPEKIYTTGVNRRTEVNLEKLG